ncbi:hypothetical protein OAS39_04305, partial [Pirellulales bacterium]|nr:hypothetical protein [Pirellulales bacterium]
RRDLTGKEFRIRAFSYDQIYKKFFYGTAAAYQDQYGLFGNPRVMPVKILWDYLIYWSITAFIYMQGQMCRQRMYMQNLPHLTKLGKLNHYMQEFFRDWHEQTLDATATGVANVSDMAIVRQWNSRLTDSMSNREFLRQFAENVAQLTLSASEIVEFAQIGAEFPFAQIKDAAAQPGVFDRALKPTTRPSPETAADVAAVEEPVG